VIDTSLQGQTALVVTERAVFEYWRSVLTLTELAPGVNLDRDVLAQMEFAPIVDRAALREMDPELFAQGAQGNAVRLTTRITSCRTRSAEDTSRAAFPVRGVGCWSSIYERRA
jgi:acyl CoA:acetate/3-ketoacid CoA transferase